MWEKHDNSQEWKCKNNRYTHNSLSKHNKKKVPTKPQRFHYHFIEHFLVRFFFLLFIKQQGCKILRILPKTRSNHFMITSIELPHVIAGRKNLLLFKQSDFWKRQWWRAANGLQIMIRSFFWTTLQLSCIQRAIWSSFRILTKKCSLKHECFINIFGRNATPLHFQIDSQWISFFCKPYYTKIVSIDNNTSSKGKALSLRGGCSSLTFLAPLLLDELPGFNLKCLFVRWNRSSS